MKLSFKALRLIISKWVGDGPSHRKHAGADATPGSRSEFQDCCISRGLIFWPFMAFEVAVTGGRESGPAVRKFWLMPALAPLFMLAGGAWTLWSGARPSDRTYGVWNWHLRNSQGDFLLA